MRRSPTPRPWRPDFRGTTGVSLSSPSYLVTPRGNPACRGTFGGRRKAVRDRLALQGGTGDFPCRPQGPCRVGTGESGLVLSEEGNPAGLSSCSGSRRFEEELSRSFSGCGRKPWVPSTCAHNLRELSGVFGRNDAKAETPILWPPDAKSRLIGKDSDAGRDWGQEEKGTTG